LNILALTKHKNQVCYYRDNNNEVESQTFDESFLKGLNYIRGILPENIRNTTLCYSGEMEQMIDRNMLVNFKNIFRE
jgi:hypothetical protein